MANVPQAPDNVQGEEEVDIEQYAARGEKPPPVCTYVVRIDDARYRVNALSITGREILALANKQPPDAYSIQQILRGGEHRVICPDQKIDLTTPGVERFATRAGVTFYIDQEEEFAPTPTLTVREILTTHAKVDASQTTLVELRGAEQIKHTDLDEVLTVKPCMRFAVYHNQPTPVS